MDEGLTFEQASYGGKARPLLWLALLTNLLAVLTLGIYRFWGKTRVRRYIWSATRFQGDGFEYTGTGLEKILGFLIAVVFLAVYLGIVNLLLFFAGLRLVPDPGTDAELAMQGGVVLISFLALLPWIYFAVYRSRRYLLARTRFRSIRFGMEAAAGGYVWRAILYQVLTVVTLGLLLPLQTFALSKYMTDRSWYGDARFLQSGRWWALYGAMKHVLVGVAMLGIAVPFALASADPVDDLPVTSILLAVLGYGWLMFGLLYYRVRSFAYLLSNTSLEGEILFRATPSTGQVLKRLILGALLLGLIALAVFTFLGVVFLAVFGGVQGGGAVVLGPAIMAVLYLLVLAVLSAAAMVFITQPVIAHIVSTTAIANAGALAFVRQRAFDKGADAEGFADALDIGGAI